jgi:hypothetical protein
VFSFIVLLGVMLMARGRSYRKGFAVGAALFAINLASVGLFVATLSKDAASSLRWVGLAISVVMLLVPLGFWYAEQSRFAEGSGEREVVDLIGLVGILTGFALLLRVI